MRLCLLLKTSRFRLLLCDRRRRYWSITLRDTQAALMILQSTRDDVSIDGTLGVCRNHLGLNERS